MYNCIGIPEKYVSVPAFHNNGSGAAPAEIQAVSVDSVGVVSSFFLRSEYYAGQ